MWRVVTIMMILTSYQSLPGPVISQPGRDSFELNTEGRMEGDDRGGQSQISLSHSKLSCEVGRLFVSFFKLLS